MSQFPDHFSGHAADYGRFRPTYPDALFAFLRAERPEARVVWDCGCGNGQASLALAVHFPEVTATDPSAAQIAAAPATPGVRFAVAPAEASGLAPKSVDLITVAQALHWFDFQAFFAEVERVAAPGAHLAAWCYELFSVNPAFDAEVLRLYHDVLGADWPPQRALLEQGYRTVPWPAAWERRSTPDFAMESRWSLPQTLGYLRTWSATQRWMKRHPGRDPVAEAAPALAAAWGAEPSQEVTVRWPLALWWLRVG